ncbi:MAG: hypothetical protein RLZZ117_844 [Cyanobacteriota bacterium]
MRCDGSKGPPLLSSLRGLCRWRWRTLVAVSLALCLALLPPSATAGAMLEVFVRDGCPHCAAAKAWLPQLQRAHPELRVRLRDLERDPAALRQLREHSRRAGVRAPGVPTFVINGTVLVGFDSPEGMGRTLLQRLETPRGNENGVNAGPLGRLSATRLGLPLFTLLLGLLDGFNPCAMWLLLFLLSLLVHWRDRRRMALVAGTFVLVSGAVYFAFMAAWLNVFLVLGLERWLQLLLAGLALAIGGVNLRDAWRSRGRFTLSIPDQAKPDLYARMRRVLQSQALAPSLLGVALLAVVVNLVELLCTAGLPALYTAVLSQQNLSAWGHYGYLGLYILGYIADDALMVGIAVWALANQRLSDRAGRRLKGLSGVVMLALGLVLLLRPAWLI